MGLFSKLFKKGEQRVIGLDIGSSAIKAVQLRHKDGKVYLDTYGSFALGPYANAAVGRAVSLPPEKVAQVVSELIKDASMAVDQVGVAMPFGSSMVTVIEMPQVPEKQLDQMIPLEARKYIPSSPDEITLDWSIISSQGKGGGQNNDKVPQMEILLVAIYNQVIDRFQSIVGASKLQALSYEIEIFGTIRSVLGKEDTGVILLMDIGAATTKVYVVENKVVRSSHTINRGSQDITSALSKSLGLSVDEAEMIKRDSGVSGSNPHIEEATSITLDHLFGETIRIIENSESKRSRAVESVILTGGGAALPGLINKASEALKIPVREADPFSKVVVPPFLTESLKSSGPEFAVAIGVGLRALEEV